MDEYLESRKQEANKIESEAKRYFMKLHVVNLRPATPDEYYDSLKDWSRPQRFKEPKRSWADKKAGITLGLKVKSLFNADAKKKLMTEREQSAVVHEANVISERESYNKYVENFYDQQHKQHREVDDLQNELRKGNAEQILSYFKYVLYQDQYSVDYLNNYPIDVKDLTFDKEKGLLCLDYRIPGNDEILTFKGFKYKEETDQILPVPIDEKHQYIQ